jgi:hypothetical protein
MTTPATALPPLRHTRGRPRTVDIAVPIANLIDARSESDVAGPQQSSPRVGYLSPLPLCRDSRTDWVAECLHTGVFLVLSDLVQFEMAARTATDLRT